LIYNRASADKAGQRVSVESQDRENRDFCASQGWDVVATVTDNNRSASRYAARDREGYRDIRAGLVDGRWGRIDVLVAWESSRAQRNLADFVAFRELCEQNRVLFAYRGRVYDLTSSNDRFSTGLDALLDEREAETAQDRTRRSHRHSVKEGRPRSFVPYGYARMYGTGGRIVKQIADPVASRVVQRIVRAVLAGDTLYAIAQALNREAVLPPRAYRAQQHREEGDPPVQHAGWSPSMLRNLLAKPTLIGQRTHNGQVVRAGTWDPIVDPGDWYRVQALLKSPGRPTARTRTATHLLSGVAECGVCGGWMRPLLNRGRLTYACAGVNPTAPKGHVARSAEKLDAWVMVQVGAYLASPQLREWLVPRPELPEQAREAVRKLEGLRAQLAEFEAEAIAGRVSAASFGRIEAQLLPQIAELESQVAVPVLPPVVAQVAGPGAERRFAALPMQEKRRVLRGVARIVVYRSVRRGVREFDPSTVEIRWAGAVG
jgi:site-specific DNA recombinase